MTGNEVRMNIGRRFVSILKILFLTLVILVTLKIPSFAAGPWKTGFAEMFVVQTMLDRGLGCFPDWDGIGERPVDHGCTGNVRRESLHSARQTLLDLAANNHVGMYREQISVAILKPTPNVNRYAQAADVIDIYEDYNLHLIISFGIPVPTWMGTPNDWCWMPTAENDDQWTEVKNNLSWTIGDFVKHLWDDPRISKSWIMSRLYVTSFSEFNAAVLPDGTYLDTIKSAIRGADLQCGVQWVLDYHGVTTNSLSASPATWDDDDTAAWLSKYYSVGGCGIPNVHIYKNSRNPDGSDGGYTRMTQQIVSAIDKFNSVIPPQYVNKIFLSETGAPAESYNCGGQPNNTTLSTTDRDLFLEHTASALANKTDALVFWRLNKLPAGWPNVSNTPCESYYGVRGIDGIYDAGAINLFNYLNSFD